jgi:tetratricopeptide (TPR) repeat protein
MPFPHATSGFIFAALWITIPKALFGAGKLRMPPDASHWTEEVVMARVIVYSILLSLIILTAYVRIERNRAVTTTEETAGNLPVSSSSQPLPAAPAVIQAAPESVESPHVRRSGETGAGQNALSPDEGEQMRLAVRKMKAGDFAGAADIFAEVAKKEKRALAAAGICYFNLGEYEQAVSYLKRAVEYDEDDFVSLKLLAFSYYRTDDLGKSLRSTKAALALKQDHDLEALQTRLKKETRAQDGYNEESSSHFTIFYDGYEHGQISREVIGLLEDAYRTIGKELDFYPSDAVTVILYGNKDFFDITQTPSWTAGYYDGKIRIPVRGAERQPEALRRILFHEYTHAVVRSITLRCPLWINEGLAEYFSGGYREKIGQAIPLRSLESSFQGLSAGNAGTAYRESYSAVSYLIEKYGVYRVKELLMALSGGDGLSQAFANSFGVTYDEFVKTWK